MRTGTASPPNSGGYSPAAPFVQPPAPRARRQPALLALGLALVGVSAAGFVYWNQKADTKTSVLVLARDVPLGQKLVAEDLQTVDIALPPGVRAIGAGSKATVLTESATTALHAGAVLTPADVSTAPGTPSGMAVVVVNLKPDFIPPGVVAGRQITLIANGVVDPGSTPAAGAAGAKASPSAAGGAPAGSSAALQVDAGAKPVLFKVTVVSLAGSKLTLAVAPNDAPAVELFADEGRFGVIVPPSGQ